MKNNLLFLLLILTTSFCIPKEITYRNYEYLVENTAKIALNDQQKNILKEYFDGQFNKYKQEAELLKETVWAKSSTIGFGILFQQLCLHTTLMVHNLVNDSCDYDIYFLMLAGQEFIDRVVQRNPELQKLIEVQTDIATCQKMHKEFFKEHIKLSVFKVYYAVYRASFTNDKSFSLLFADTLNKELVSFADYLRGVDSILEFCKANPNHKSVKTINLVYKQAAPQFYVAYMWKWLVTGEYTFMPNDFKRHYLICAAQDIGKELGWDKEKIDAGIEALLTELERIQKQ